MQTLIIILAFAAGAVAAGAGVGASFARAARRRLVRERAGRDRERAARERARRAEQLAYAGTLAGGLIHEIKNPLNTMSMNLQLLAEDLAKAESQEQRRALRRVNTLESETRRLAAILDDFLGFVRGHPLELAEGDVNQVVEDLVAFVSPEMASRRIEIRKSIGAPPPCRFDANLLKQVLLNLLLNAEQAMEENGPREIIVRTAAENGEARIDVIDTGRGIPPENLEKIFEAFFSTRKGGTGLGLPTARRIVEEHGGRLTVHSEPGKGSCFSVFLKGEKKADGSER